MTDDWQPIKTHSKDQTPVDLWLGNAELTRRVTDCIYMQGGEQQLQSFGQNYCKAPRWWVLGKFPMFDEEITHFRPIPKPPRMTNG